MPCVTNNTTFFFKLRSKNRQQEREREGEKNKEKTNQARSCMREYRQKLRHIDVDVIKWV
jgi:hypothetical protein